MLRIVKKNVVSYKRWKTVKVLIIDEISMVTAQYFDNLDQMVQKIRNNNLPFGGIQLVLSGDFMQLPPPSKDSKFLFESQIWNRLKLKIFYLDTVYRQNDSKFIKILNELRIGSPSASSIKTLHLLSRIPEIFNSISPTTLFSLKTEVDLMNQKFLDKIPSPLLSYPSLDYFSNGQRCTEIAQKQLDSAFLAVQNLKLKIGAQIMIIRNIPSSGLHNGQRAIITNLGKDHVEIECINGAIRTRITLGREEFATEASSAPSTCYPIRRQFPIMLAYAMTIHKSQGQTIKYLSVDLKNTFESGQAYVALSRAVGMDTLQVLNFDPHKIVVNEKVKVFMDGILQKP